MDYFYVEPEVAGGLGPLTVMDTTTHPPIVSKLHYHFDGWLGNVLLETFPCFIVTDGACQALQAIDATGAKFDDVEVTVSEQFEELYPNKQLPKFVWLKADGKPKLDDFATTPDGRLIVSARALEVLQGLGISNALITSSSS
jgi:hypothetical protein